MRIRAGVSTLRPCSPRWRSGHPSDRLSCHTSARNALDAFTWGRRACSTMGRPDYPGAPSLSKAEPGTDDRIAKASAGAAGRPLSLLVNNAGLAHYMPFVDLPQAKAEELVRVNVLAPTLIARAALPGMVQRQQGTIINVASLLAF